MTDLVERLRSRADDERPTKPFNLLLDAAEHIEQLRRELETVTGLWTFLTAKAVELATKLTEARKAAFIEAAEIAEETAQGSDHLLKAASQAKDIQGALVHGEGVMTARIIATALRRKAEGRP